jgi:hypothetical protein
MRMSNESLVTYAVPTHLQEREPFAFGRTVGEVAKLVAIGFVAVQLVGSEDLPGALRLPAAVAVLVIGAGWALVRIQRRPLDGWLGVAFRYGATPRRRVWRSSALMLAAGEEPAKGEPSGGWYELERVRVRWAEPATALGGHDGPSQAILPIKSGGST